MLIQHHVMLAGSRAPAELNIGHQRTFQIASSLLLSEAPTTWSPACGAFAISVKTNSSSPSLVGIIINTILPHQMITSSDLLVFAQDQGGHCAATYMLICWTGLSAYTVLVHPGLVKTGIEGRGGGDYPDRGTLHTAPHPSSHHSTWAGWAV